MRRSQEARARARAVRERARRGRSQREMLRDSALARLHARLQTMPVTEQAKGIIMGQVQCEPEEGDGALAAARAVRPNAKAAGRAAAPSGETPASPRWLRREPSPVQRCPSVIPAPMSGAQPALAGPRAEAWLPS